MQAKNREVLKTDGQLIQSKPMAWIETTLWSLTFFGLITMTSQIANQVAISVGAGPQLRASLSITGIALGEWLVVGMLGLALHRQGSGWRALGWNKGAPLWAWLAVVAIVILNVSSDLLGVLKGFAHPLEFSVFRLYGGIVAGGTAGFCEEAVFRGYIMTRLRDAGISPVLQVLASGFWFGLVHFNFGTSLLTTFTVTVGNMVLGVLFALVYLLGRRSLLPVVGAHVLIDLIIEPWLVLRLLH